MTPNKMSVVGKIVLLIKKYPRNTIQKMDLERMQVFVKNKVPKFQKGKFEICFINSFAGIIVSIIIIIPTLE